MNPDSKQKYFNLSFDMDNIDVLFSAYNINIIDFDRTLLYRTAVRRLINLLDAHKIKATFFIVGKCCEHEDNISVIRELAESGHEIGNHSYSHRNNYDISDDQVIEEIQKSHELIVSKIGVTPTGYRAPGYQVTNKVIKTLVDLGYIYDASIMPTAFMPLLWIILFLKTFNKRNKFRICRFFHLFNSRFPFRINGYDNFYELPCPSIWRLVPYYATFNFAFPWIEKFTYKKIVDNNFITFEGHALDFLDVELDNLPRKLMEFHPGMQLSWQHKVNYYNSIIDKFKSTHQIVTLSQYVSMNKANFPVNTLKI